MAPPDEEDSEMLEVVKEGMNLELEPDQNDKCSLGVDSKNYDNRFELAHQVIYSASPHHSHTRSSHFLNVMIFAVSLFHLSC